MSKKKETKPKAPALPKADNPNHKKDFLQVLEMAVNPSNTIVKK